MNAYELEQAAFDSACDCATESVDYIVGYADGAFGIDVSENTAWIILERRAAFAASEQGSNNHFHIVEAPLSAIEL